MHRRVPQHAGEGHGKAPEPAFGGDRRFICSDCGTKWYVPASRADLVDPGRCASCGGALLPYVGPQA